MLSTVSASYPLVQNFLFPNLYFIFACLSKVINVDLLLSYPINSEILHFGGISINICTWSGHASASSNLHPGFLSIDIRSIFPISNRNLLYITILWYFGTITRWYFHRHVVCDKLFLSFIWQIPSFIFVAGCHTCFIISKGICFFSASLSLVPRALHVVSLPIKKAEHLLFCLFTSF